MDREIRGKPSRVETRGETRLERLGRHATIRISPRIAAQWTCTARGSSSAGASQKQLLATPAGDPHAAAVDREIRRRGNRSTAETRMVAHSMVAHSMVAHSMVAHSMVAHSVAHSMVAASLAAAAVVAVAFLTAAVAVARTFELTPYLFW